MYSGFRQLIFSTRVYSRRGLVEYSLHRRAENRLCAFLSNIIMQKYPILVQLVREDRGFWRDLYILRVPVIGLHADYGTVMLPWLGTRPKHTHAMRWNAVGSVVDHTQTESDVTRLSVAQSLIAYGC